MNLTRILCVSCLLLPASLPAQAAGLRGGVQESQLVTRLPAPDPVAAERVITVEAIAEVRVMPTELRVVFAASATAATATETNAASARLLADVRTRLAAAGVPAGNIDQDFIVMVPVYTWGVTRQSDRDVIAEQRTGYRLQHNLHVRVRDEASASAVIAAAHEVEGIEVLAIDYWSDQLQQKQIEARDKALAAVQQKAKALLAVFATAPAPINVHESTHVMFPQELYQSLPHTTDNSRGYFGGELPRVPASRPTYVYYRGLFADLDVVETAMPSRREIHIVSTVRLYFEAPHRPRQHDGK